MSFRWCWTIEIAIFGDLFMPSSLIKECLIARLGQCQGLKICEHEVSIEERDNAQGVSEYWGDPKKIVANIDGTEILIVHAAPVNAEVIDAAGSLRLIGCCRSGAANVDVSYATRKGIPVLFTPGRNAQGVADLTIGLIICESRGIARADAQMRSGVFGVPQVGVELSGKTLGIIGLGSVGSAVACRARNGFNMEVMAFDPYISEERAEELGAKLVDLETLLKKSDFVTVHSRASFNGEPQITAKHIAMMKSNAYLINTSRGSVVDERALVEALRNGTIAGAALDVYAKEPVKADNPLLKLDNVTLTPHIGGITLEVPLRTAEIMAEDVARFIRGERPRNVLNSEVFDS